MLGVGQAVNDGLESILTIINVSRQIQSLDTIHAHNGKIEQMWLGLIKSCLQSWKMSNMP